MNADEPVAEIRYEGEIQVRPFRRGTYLGDHNLEMLIERTLGPRYRFGEGWTGRAVVTIEFREAPAHAASAEGGPGSRTPRHEG